MHYMEISNKIVLRPRFKIALKHSSEVILKVFEATKENQKEYMVSRVDEHIFIRIPKEHQHFWTPQLHLEIHPENENESLLHGFFGPNPKVWTLFMFLHFVIGILFIGLGIWVYSNAMLNQEYALQIAGMVFLLLCWIGLYVGGSIGKATGKKQMQELYDFMNKTLQV